jgi:hypothetical protein
MIKESKRTNGIEKNEENKKKEKDIISITIINMLG